LSTTEKRSSVLRGGIDTAARHPLQRFLSFAQRHREFALGNPVIPDSRNDVTAATLLEIGIDAKKGEWRNDQYENSNHDRSTMLFDKSEHGSLHCN